VGAIPRDQDEKSAIPGESEEYSKEKIVNDALHSTAFRSQARFYNSSSSGPRRPPPKVDRPEPRKNFRG